MGFKTYNHYSCFPNQSIVQSNARALKDLGLADLGYYYVTTDCGWTLPERAPDGKLAWNETLFPDGLPALGDLIHGLDLGFGVYSDSGVQMCMTGLPNQTGSLFHEQADAPTGKQNSWKPRMRVMRDALNETGRDILYHICDWGVDFPSAWAPELGNTYRITNDKWPTIYRRVNQLVPSASYAGPGPWPDLEMLESGKSSKSNAALYRGWAGRLSEGRTVAALVNWNNHSVAGTLDLPDIGLQSAGTVKDIWNANTVSNVATSYSGDIAAHGTLLMELSDTTPSGMYLAARCGHFQDGAIVFGDVYGITDSDSYTLAISLAEGSQNAPVTLYSLASPSIKTAQTSAGAANSTVSMKAGIQNQITVKTTAALSSIEITPLEGIFYASTAFEVSGSAYRSQCTPGQCTPVGSKITNFTQAGAASISIPMDLHAVGSFRYVELTYINNDVSLDTSWTNGTNTRNVTVAVNDAAPVRLDVPLSGRSSELFSPMKGWGDPATLGVLVDGFGSGRGTKEIVVSNANGNAGVNPYGAEFVGLRVI